MKNNPIGILLQDKKTIFTTNDIALYWEETNLNTVKAKTAYYTKVGQLKRLTRGVYTPRDVYNTDELATSLYTPSYLTFETVTGRWGMTFQSYDSLMVAGPVSRKFTIDTVKIVMRKMKRSVLYNKTGILLQDGYSIATPERAFLDIIYTSPDYYFDRLDKIDWEKCFEIVKIYENKALEKRLKEYRKKYAQSN